MLSLVHIIDAHLLLRRDKDKLQSSTPLLIALTLTHLNQDTKRSLDLISFQKYFQMFKKYSKRSTIFAVTVPPARGSDRTI